MQIKKPFLSIFYYCDKFLFPIVARTLNAKMCWQNENLVFKMAIQFVAISSDLVCPQRKTKSTNINFHFTIMNWRKGGLVSNSPKYRHFRKCK
jgi:hypothetical protein